MLPPLTAATPPSKRGLCHVPSLQHPNDDKIWTTGSPPLTWYYNYRSSPSPAYLDDKTLQFVPMLWGASATATDTDTDTGTPFLSSIKTQLGSGANITHVLAFNEPDGPYETGGCALPVDLAAARWKAELEPLRNLGVKVGLPAVTGGEAGWAWMEGFFSACEGGCRPDFVPVHWYGDFDGLMSHVGRVTVAYPHLEIWVTEFGFPGRDRGATEEFVRRSVAAFDGWGYVLCVSGGEWDDDQGADAEGVGMLRDMLILELLGRTSPTWDLMLRCLMREASLRRLDCGMWAEGLRIMCR